MKLMVLDGNSLINRAYHGVRPLSTSQGLQTNAIFGFLTTLQRLTDEEKQIILAGCLMNWYAAHAKK